MSNYAHLFKESKMFEVKTELLKSALLFSSKEKTRYNLNGVYFEKTETGVAIVTTDGHRMFVAKVQVDDACSNFEPFIIPNEIIKQVLTGYKGTTVLVNEWDKIIGNINFAPIDGTFPNWRRVLVTEPVSNEPAQFNPVYIGDIGKVNKLLKTQSTIHYNGNNPAPVTFTSRDDCFLILMPMKCEKPVDPITTIKDISGVFIETTLKPDLKIVK